MQSFSAITILALSLMAFTPGKNSSTPQKQKKQKGWISLFDGKTTKGWHTYGKTTVGDAWKVKEGILYFDATNKATWKSKDEGGDIVSDKEFENFHFSIEWKVSKNGNSGIMFWVQDDPAKYERVWYTGPEMQALDNDGHPDGKIIKHRAGNLYDLIAGTEGAVKPVGEWNKAEIISNRGKLDFYLNGVNTVSTTYGDDNWRQMIANSKFKTKVDFGKTFKGHFALQDHGNDVWFRNIMIKKL